MTVFMIYAKCTHIGIGIASVTIAINALYIKIGWSKCAVNRESNSTVIATMYQYSKILCH